MKSLRLLLAVLPAFAALAAGRLESGFANPPDQTKPWCYWYWISDHLSKEGITRDLEAMARVGIGEALIGNIHLDDVPAGDIKVLSPEWWALIEHAICEGGRVGVNIGMFNCPGWSQSGGPWIQSTETMRYLATAEMRVTGPQRFTGRLPVPREPFQDVVLLAFPAPRHDADSLRHHAPRVSCTPGVADASRLADGDSATSIEFPARAGRGESPIIVEFAVDTPFTARSIEIVPGERALAAQCDLQVAAATGGWQTVRRFSCDRSNMALGVGFLPRGPVTVSIPPTTANRFRVVFSEVSTGGPAVLAEVNLSGAARLESVIEKQLGKMHPTPLPLWDAYLWPTQAEPDSGELVIPAAEVRDLTRQVAADGTLTWDVPAGEWVLQRIGMTPTGMRNSPASPEGQGLEVDKMNRALAQQHFDAFIGEVLRRLPASERKAFKRVVADSYEMGSQNWTDGFDAQFRRRYGYDPKPWLPVLSGRLVGSADQSERFLWDLRRLVADRVATDYVGGLRDACRPHGLGLWLENYGHWGFPGEFLKYGGESDRIGGEYWVTGDLGSIECRAASSCANTYGKPFVSAESFTGGPAFQNAPAALKARGDWAFCEGVNHFVLHVCIHQPWEDKVPGVNAWFGTEFNRHNTWFERSKTWVDYLRRCCWLLQQGHRVADVAYFIGEDAPKMTGVRQPQLPPGRDFDYINADVIETKLSVKDGVLTLPHGTTYRVLVLPELDTMRPEVLRKVRDLVKAGATVLGRPPSRSPSLQNHPRCDAEVRQLAAELWGGANTAQPGERTFGRGRVVWGRPLADVLLALGSATDFEASAPLRFTHRRSGAADLYFVAHPKPSPLTATVALRAGDKAPELWWPDSGRIERPAVYDVSNGIVRLPLAFGPHGSVFVVLRDRAVDAANRIVSVQRDGRELLGTRVPSAATATAVIPPNHFTLAAWVKPEAATELQSASRQGAAALGWKRNDLLAAPHGNQFASTGHAGCGLAVGTNGVSVLEHAANYFAATLVHTAPLRDWTHLAVVYRDGQPTLYLDGVPAATGLRSEHVVHSGAQAGPLAQFRGQAGEVQEIGRALNDSEVADLARAMPRPDRSGGGPGLQLTRTGRRIAAQAAQRGDYELLMADGTTRRLTVPAMPDTRVLDGPWDVQFAPGRGAPERVTFEPLVDWTRHPDAGIRHFSGAAVYRKPFALPSPVATEAGARLILDLGSVRDLATVRVNGREIGTRWLAPFQFDITDAARPGSNTLEIEIVNVWNNRLVGDAALPAGQRMSFLLAPTVSKDAPLLPAGLLGPVRLRTELQAQAESVAAGADHGR
ncbi:MAG TPA: glycosyl hydrolase [Verrucomicrobiota bacterium]|nr:glycosyl hydrolase [Verrucomicrobiota bacterium]HNU51068.1 glycosyl hydrolase [Verrucomicrobiota bacterium]